MGTPFSRIDAPSGTTVIPGPGWPGHNTNTGLIETAVPSLALLVAPVSIATTAVQVLTGGHQLTVVILQAGATGGTLYLEDATAADPVQITVPLANNEYRILQLPWTLINGLRARMSAGSCTIQVFGRFTGA